LLNLVSASWTPQAEDLQLVRKLVEQGSWPLSNMACDFAIDVKTVLKKYLRLPFHVVIHIGPWNVIEVDAISSTAAFVDDKIVKFGTDDNNPGCPSQ
jgi:hypothetical protein